MAVKQKKEDGIGELIKTVVPITSGNISNEELPDTSAECVGGGCPIR